MVVVGAVGSHLTQLTRLALHVSELRPITIDSSRPTSFFDSFRSAIRVAGIEGQPVSVMLSARYEILGLQLRPTKLLHICFHDVYQRTSQPAILGCNQQSSHLWRISASVFERRDGGVNPGCCDFLFTLFHLDSL